jgi:WD40 repeat protein
MTHFYRRSTLCTALLALALAPGLSLAEPPAKTKAAQGRAKGEKFAFLVGVRQYLATELKSLQYAEQDVRDLSKVLLASGYKPDNVVLMTQSQAAENLRYAPEGAKIRQELDGILEDLTEEDSVIVALAGHGVQFRGEDRSYFCPADAKLANRETLIALDEIYEKLNKCGAGFKLLMVDACRNDPLANASRSREEVELESVTRPQIRKPPGGVAAFFSCSEGEKAFEHDELKHGVFFNFIIEGLRGRADEDGDKVVDFDELVSFTKKNVRSFVRAKFGANVRQMPELFRNTTRGSVPLVALNLTSPKNLDALPPTNKLLGREFQGHTGLVVSVALSPDGKRAVSGSWDRTVRLWDVTTGKELRRFGQEGAGHTAPVNAVAYSPDGKTALSGGDDALVILWEVETGKLLKTFKGHKGHINAVAFSVSGQYAISAAGHTENKEKVDCTVRLWDVESGKEVRRYDGLTTPVQCVAFNPKGKSLAAGAKDGTVRIWDWNTKQEKASFKAHTGMVTCVAWSPDGTRLLTGGDKTMRLWDAATGQQLKQFDGHKEEVWCVAFSPDGTRALSGSGDYGRKKQVIDGVARLWDLETGQELFRLEGHKGVIKSVAFSRDGHRALSGSDDKTLRLWDLPK